jgi:antitoxin ParD1/3/4
VTCTSPEKAPGLQELSIFDNLNQPTTVANYFSGGKIMPSSYVIGEHFEEFIKAQIQQGRYASASEVIRDGLRSLEDREKFRAVKLEVLRAEIQKGADSGPGIPAEEVFANLRARIARIAADQADQLGKS